MGISGGGIGVVSKVHMKPFLAAIFLGVMSFVGEFAVADERTIANQRQAIAEICKLDAVLRIEQRDGEVVKVDFSNKPVNDGDLASLEVLRELRTLNLRGSPITDAGLKHLEGLTQLRDLDLSSTKVTDNGLERLKGLTHLRTLVLQYTRVAGAGLRHLEGLTQLGDA